MLNVVKMMNVIALNENDFWLLIASLLEWNFSVVWVIIFIYLLASINYLGAGGLGIGMDLSRFVETKYAVEYEPSAAKTYK